MSSTLMMLLVLLMRAMMALQQLTLRHRGQRTVSDACVTKP